MAAMEDKPALKHEDSGATDAVGGRVPQQWLMDGFVEARARFQAAVDRDARPEDTFIPLFEALSWIHTIDDFLKNRGIKDEESLRRGFRFVRNRVHHQWADAIDPKPVEVSHQCRFWGTLESP